MSYEEATLKGTVNPEGSATSYYFEYGTTESYGTKIPVSPASVGSGTSNVSVRQLVTGLSQSTTYHFRVVAEGEATTKGEDLTFTTAGFNFEFGEEGSGEGQFDQPFDAAVDGEGNIWVTDTENNRVQKFNYKEGEYLDQVGEEGGGAGQLNAPTGIVTPAAQKLLILDAGNSRVEGWTVGAEPPSVFTAPASDIKTNSATLHATINPEGFTTTYYFEWGLTTSYGNQIPISPESIGSGLSNVRVNQGISGLAEGTIYHFRAVAESAAGITTGKDRMVKTL